MKIEITGTDDKQKQPVNLDMADVPYATIHLRKGAKTVEVWQDRSKEPCLHIEIRKE